MKDIWQKLTNDFPVLYGNTSFQGFQCSATWEPVIRRLSEKLDDLNKNTAFPPVSALQVKSKFAGLRYYTDGLNDDIEQLIEQAEMECAKICEECGAEGTVHETKDKWLINLCPICAKKMKATVSDMEVVDYGVKPNGIHIRVLTPKGTPR